MAIKLSDPRTFRPVVTVVAVVIAPFFVAIIIATWSGGLVVRARWSRSGRGLVVGARRSRSGRGLVVGARWRRSGCGRSSSDAMMAVQLLPKAIA